LVQNALERNRELLAARQRLAEAQALLRQAGVRPAPAIEVNGASGRPLGAVGEADFSVGYFQPVETYGKRAKRVRVAEVSVGLAEAELAERIRQITFDVKTRFIDAVSERWKLEALDRLVKVNRESYQMTEFRVRQGDAAPLEGQLLLVELNRTEAERATTIGRAQTALLELRTLIGGADSLVLKEDLDLKRRGFAFDELRQRALRSRPDLRVARLLEQQGEAEVELAEAQARPDLTLSAQYQLRRSQFEDPIRRTETGSHLPLRDRDNILAFGVSIPVLNRSRNLGNIEAAVARARSARLRREHLESVILLEVEATWRRWEAAMRALEVFNRGVVGQSERNLEIIRQAYSLGQLRLLDVLNEQRRLIDTEMIYFDARAEAARAFAELERAVGGDLR